MPTHKQRRKGGNRSQPTNATNVVSANNVQNSQQEKSTEQLCCGKSKNDASKLVKNGTKNSKLNKQSFLLYAPCALLDLVNVCMKLDKVNVSDKNKNAAVKNSQNNNNNNMQLEKRRKNSTNNSGKICCDKRNSAVSEKNDANNGSSAVPSIVWTLNSCRSFTSSPYPHGMLNSSNFCFINSIMQVLIYIPSFAQLVCSIAAFPSLFALHDTLYNWWLNNISKTCPTIIVLAKWFAQYWKAGVSRQTLAAPKLPFALGAKNARCVDGSAQQDAHEFLQKMLETLNDELYEFEHLLREHDYVKSRDVSKYDEKQSNTFDKCSSSNTSGKANNDTESKQGKRSTLKTHSHTNNKNKSSNIEDELKGWTFVGGKEKLSIREAAVDDDRSVLLEQLFNGRLETHINGTRKSQYYSSVLVERFYSFGVDIGFAAECTLEEAIERTCMTEHIYDSDRDKNLRKTVRFRTLPEILVLHLRRWTVTREGELVKLDNHIKFGRILVLPQHVCGSNYTSKNSRSFHLLSAVAHRGASLMQGHYVTYLAKHVANPTVTSNTQNGSENDAGSSMSSSHVVLCNDTKITLCNITEMYDEPVYFLIYQKAGESPQSIT